MPPRRTPFSRRLIAWQRRHGRHDLPWQGTRDAYRIWVAEVMLQQTQVAAAIPYYERFLARFPALEGLAAAPEDEVLAHWSGLGYYARGRNLHRAAREVMARFAGRFPAAFDEISSLPGIGRSTAGAIAVFAAGERRAILDGNVRRVLARHAGIAGDPASAGVLARLWAEAESRLPARGIEAYTQGLMDLGALVCLPRSPRCEACPVRADCVARIEDRVAGLPGRRRRAPAPLRRVAMLMVVSRGEVLLVKRPAPGIWGGLWSLPEAAATARPAEVLRRRWGLRVARAERLEPFTHAFTHFTLEVVAWRVRKKGSDPIRPRIGSDPFIWLPLAEIEGAALPAPVRRLLSREAAAGEGTGAGSRGARPRPRVRAASASRRS